MVVSVGFERFFAGYLLAVVIIESSGNGENRAHMQHVFAVISICQNTSGEFAKSRWGLCRWLGVLKRCAGLKPSKLKSVCFACALKPSV